MRKNYTAEEKQAVIEKYLSGITITEISKETGIGRNTIYTWIQPNNKKKPEKVNMKDYLNLKKKCVQQEKMIEILQSANCTVSAPLKDRYNVIQELKEQYSIYLLCKTMKVAKGSYYNHILRAKRENTLAAQKRAELTPIIEEIFNANKQIFGAARIHAILKDRGYKTSQNTIADIMHENGWFAITGGARKQYYINLERKENILKQNFTVSRPNEVWVSDVTYFRYNKTTFYICVIIDLFARKVVGYRVSLSNSTQLTRGTFMTAYKSRNPTELLFHSDQGSNYTSNTFRAYLRDLGVKQSFSATGTPYNNSVMESFFKTLKTEKLYRIDFRSERELREAIKDYIHYYNNERPHSVLCYRTPDRYEADYLRKQQALVE